MGVGMLVEEIEGAEVVGDASGREVEMGEGDAGLVTALRRTEGGAIVEGARVEGRSCNVRACTWGSLRAGNALYKWKTSVFGKKTGFQTKPSKRFVRDFSQEERLSSHLMDRQPPQDDSGRT